MNLQKYFNGGIPICRADNPWGKAGLVYQQRLW